jgi:hypothetical protein
MSYLSIDNLGVLISTTSETVFTGNVTTTAMLDPSAGIKFVHKQGKGNLETPAMFLAPLQTTESTFYSYTYDSILGWINYDYDNVFNSEWIGTTTVGIPCATSVTTTCSTLFSTETTFNFYSNTTSGIPSAVTFLGNILTAPGGSSGYISDLSSINSISFAGSLVTAYAAWFPYIATYGNSEGTNSSDFSDPYFGYSYSTTRSYDTSGTDTTTSTTSYSDIVAYFDGMQFASKFFTSFNQDRRVAEQIAAIKWNSTAIPITSTSYQETETTTTFTTQSFDDGSGGFLEGIVTFYGSNQTEPNLFHGTFYNQVPSGWLTVQDGIFGPDYLDNGEFSEISWIFTETQPLLINPLQATVSYSIPTMNESSYWVFLDDSGGSTACYDFSSPLPVIASRNIAGFQYANYKDNLGNIFLPGEAEVIGYGQGMLTSPYDEYAFGEITRAFSVTVNGLSLSWQYIISESNYSTSSSEFKTSNPIRSSNTYLSTISQEFNQSSFCLPTYATNTMEINLSYLGVLGITTFYTTYGTNSTNSLITYIKTEKSSTVMTAKWDLTQAETTSFNLISNQTISISPNGYWMTPIDNATGIQ